MIGNYEFTRTEDRIYVVGHDFGSQLIVIAESGKRMLWKWPGHSAWNGNYQPWKWFGTVYMAVEILQGDAQKGTVEKIREEQPGRSYRKILEELKAWVAAASD
jgi:hypothetical protein